MSESIDKANAQFWDELCGSTLAKALGIKDNSPESLKLFDDWYLDFYPYLMKHAAVAKMQGKKVLEIGLGYGTLGQQIAAAGATYTGLDIAAGPVAMMNHRMSQSGLNGKAMQGSMLDCPLESGSMDFVVSIGCFHHTGNVKSCIDETYRVLKPGGEARIMVYNKYSLRQWIRWPKHTLYALLQELDINKKGLAVSAGQRAAYDVNQNGEAAPETVFHSIHELKDMFGKFSQMQVHKENFGSILLVPRNILLLTVGKMAGLDLYIYAKK